MDAFTIIDQNVIACKSANFLRYFLRFVSAYLVVAFTVQRLLVISKPLRTRYKSKKLAWITLGWIVLIGFVLNVPMAFLFHLETIENSLTVYCDVDKSVKSEYLFMNSVYIFTIIIVPSIVIFFSNCLIIYKTKQQKHSRQTLMETSSSKNKSNPNLLTIKPIQNDQLTLSKSHENDSKVKSLSVQNLKQTNSSLKRHNLTANPILRLDNFSSSLKITKSNHSLTTDSRLPNQVSYNSDSALTSEQKSNHLNEISVCSESKAKSQPKLKPHYWTKEQMSNNRKNKTKISTVRLTFMLLVFSFSFIALNVPYLTIWLIYFSRTAYHLMNAISSDLLFGALQITEILFILNYSIKFFLCLTFSMFRTELKIKGKTLCLHTLIYIFY